MENTKESLAGLMIGYKFKRPALLAQALTHPSYAEEGGGCHNGALVLLGEKTLEEVVWRALLEHFGFASPRGELLCHKSEAELEKIKDGMLCDAALARRAQLLLLDGCAYFGREESLSDAAEDGMQARLLRAIVGAVAWDCGGKRKPLSAAVWHLLSLEDGLTDTPAEGDNFVLALGKRSEDRFGRLPLYRFRKTRSGYLAGVRFPNGAKGASGRGRSKCEAKQEAARRSLVLLPPIEEPFFSAE